MFKNCKIVGDNVGYEIYHRQDAKRGDGDFSMSRSELITFAQCPAKWRDGFQSGDDSNSSTEWGSLIDCLLTQPKRFDELFAVRPETYPDKKTGEPKPFNLNSTWCKEWVESQKGKTVIKPEIRTEAETAVKAIQDDAAVSELLKISRKQVFVLGIWKDKETKLEIPVRGLIDLVPPANHLAVGKWLADFKTARNGDPANWARVVDDCGYDVQAALYTDLYTGATGEDRTDWVFAVQENVAPFHVVNPMPAMSAEFIAWGRVKYQSALEYYCRCLRADKWPSYQIHGMATGSVQVIGPDELWHYRQLAGRGSLQMSEPNKSKSAVEQDDIPS